MDDNNIPSSTTMGTWTLGDSAKCGAHSAKQVFPHCDEACFEAQLLEGHRRMGIAESEPLCSVQSNDGQELGGFGAEFIGGNFN